MNEKELKAFLAARDFLVGAERVSVSYGLWNQGACFAYWIFHRRWIICWYSWRYFTQHPAKIYSHLVQKTHRSVEIFRVISTWNLHFLLHHLRSSENDRFVISTVNVGWIGKRMIYLHFTLAILLSLSKSVTNRVGVSRNMKMSNRKDRQ